MQGKTSTIATGTEMLIFAPWVGAHQHTPTNSLVGRCSHSLSRCRCAARPQRHPLLSRLWLPAHDHPALSGQRASPPAATHPLARADDRGREETARGRRVLGQLRPRKGEWRGLPMQVRHRHCRRRDQAGQLHRPVGRSGRRLGLAVSGPEHSHARLPFFGIFIASSQTCALPPFLPSAPTVQCTLLSWRFGEGELV